MGMQVIKQPDGKYALFSSFSDTICAYDQTRRQIISIFMKRAAKDARSNTERILDELDGGKKPYYQFTMTWAEAVNKHKKREITDEEYAAGLAETIERLKKT
jgi:hypothetical protein